MSVLDEGAYVVREDVETQPKRRPRWCNSVEWTLSALLLRYLHPLKRGFLGDAWNRHGVRVSVCRCPDCGEAFFACPAFEPQQRIPENVACLSDTCTSYDPHRDASFLFAPDPEDS